MVPKTSFVLLAILVLLEAVCLTATNLVRTTKEVISINLAGFTYY